MRCYALYNPSTATTNPSSTTIRHHFPLVKLFPFTTERKRMCTLFMLRDGVEDERGGRARRRPRRRQGRGAGRALAVFERPERARRSTPAR